MANGLDMERNSGACPYCAGKLEAGKFRGEFNHGSSNRRGNKAEREP